MIIRPADIDDAHAIATIHVRSWQHTYTDILPEEGLQALSIEQRALQWAGWLQAETSPMQTLVAEIDDKIVGFARWGPSSDDNADSTTVMLYSLYVLPDATSKGIGSALLEATVVDMIASGAEIGTLHVLKENIPSRKFYERQGWQEEPDSTEVEHFFGMEMTTVRYRKSLT